MRRLNKIARGIWREKRGENQGEEGGGGGTKLIKNNFLDGNTKKEDARAYEGIRPKGLRCAIMHERSPKPRKIKEQEGIKKKRTDIPTNGEGMN